MGIADIPEGYDKRCRSPLFVPLNHYKKLMLPAVLVMGAICYLRSLSIGYVADDFDIFYALTERAFSPLDPFPAGRGTYFRPAATGSLYLERLIAETPFLHHGVNVALHILNAGLLVSVLLQIGLRSSLSTFLAGLFYLHRSAVPNVYWIAARPELLSTAGYLAAILSFILYVRGKSAAACLIAFLLSTLLALSAKESAVTLPLVLAIAARFAVPRNEVIRSPSPLTLASAGLSLLFVVFLWLIYYSLGFRPTAPTAASMFAGTVRGVILALVPVSEWTLHRWAEDLSVAGAIGLLLVAILLLIVLFRRRAVVSQGFGLTLFTIGILPVVIMQGGASARQLYLPVALWCIGWTITSRNAESVRPAYAAAAVCYLILTWTSANLLGSEWMRSQAVAENCCRDLRRLANPSEPILLLTTPRSIGDAPVFSNDSRAALYYCFQRRFGYAFNITPVSEVAMSSSGMRLERKASSNGDRYEARISAPWGWFILPADRHTGETLNTPYGTIRILQRGRIPGSVQAFEWRQKSESTPQNYLAVEYEGQGFRLIWQRRE